MKIHYTGQQGPGWGWGEFGTNIVRELKLKGIYTDSPLDADCILHPLADHDLNVATNHRAAINLAVCFFEYELGPNAANNAARYDTVFAGSTWCLDRLAERGIHNTALLIQGVDGEVFKPQPKRKKTRYAAGICVGNGMKSTVYADPKPGDFRIFSGGKFEYRKGQDLVIAAFREFAKTHPEAHLVCSWFNPWPSLINQCIALSDVVKWPDGQFTSQEDFFTALMLANGISRDQFTILPQLSHADLAREMANTDCGLFPNRCEGGTNLVLMEYAAIARPVIANTLTGHADVAEAIHYQIWVKENPETRWVEQRMPNIINAMESAFELRGMEHKPAPRWPWAAAAATVADRCFTCVK
jgi:glycosyltransferase involved in cell wall biosynthesis